MARCRIVWLAASVCGFILSACALPQQRISESSALNIPLTLPSDSVLLEMESRSVRIFVDGNASSRSNGSGTIIRLQNHYYVITAFHVVFGTRFSGLNELATQQRNLDVEIELYDRSRVMPLASLAVPDLDLVLLGPILLPKKYESFRMVNEETEDPKRFQPSTVILWGSPLGYGPAPALGFVRGSSFIMRLYGRDVKPFVVMNVSADGLPGLSGGGIFDLDGRLVGIIISAEPHKFAKSRSEVSGVPMGMMWKELVRTMDHQPWSRSHKLYE